MTRRSSLILLAATVTLLFAVAAGRLQAQPLREPPRWLVGAAAGVVGTGRSTLSELVTVALHATHFAPGRLGLELAVGTAPRQLVEGTLGLGMRLGGSVPLTIQPDLYLLPSAGLSTLLAVSEGQARGGLQVGLAALQVAPGSWGWRVGASWHRLNGIPGTVWLLELGFVR